MASLQRVVTVSGVLPRTGRSSATAAYESRSQLRQATPPPPPLGRGPPGARLRPGKSLSRHGSAEGDSGLTAGGSRRIRITKKEAKNRASPEVTAASRCVVFRAEQG